MPGSPDRFDPTPNRAFPRPRHPAAYLLFALLAGAGISFARAPLALAAVTLAFACLALREEGRRPRRELPFLALAAVLFVAHAALARFEPAATRAALLLALRLLALVYLTRWAARSFLPGTAQWILSLPMPARPRPAALAVESARFSAAMLPLAAREAEAQTLALRARGVSAGRGFGSRARFLAVWLLPFLGTMLRVGDSLADALHARGYVPGARRAGLSRPSWRWGDVALVAIGALVAGGLLRGV